MRQFGSIRFPADRYQYAIYSPQQAGYTGNIAPLSLMPHNCFSRMLSIDSYLNGKQKAGNGNIWMEGRPERKRKVGGHNSLFLAYPCRPPNTLIMQSYPLIVIGHSIHLPSPPGTIASYSRSLLYESRSVRPRVQLPVSSPGSTTYIQNTLIIITMEGVAITYSIQLQQGNS